MKQCEKKEDKRIFLEVKQEWISYEAREDGKNETASY